MKGEYQYLKQVSYMDSISIDNLGNFVLKAYNDLGDEYLLIVRTVMGVSRILEIGPIEQGARTAYSCRFDQMDYNEKSIDKIIKWFLNGSYGITQVEVFDTKSREDFESFTIGLPDVRDFLYD